MEEQSYEQFIGPHLKTMSQLTQNKKCLVTGCPNKPIDSHVIAESVLDRIDEQGCVYTWEPRNGDISKNAHIGNDQLNVYQQPRLVGIRNDAIYPLFCEEHDGKPFRELEHHGFSSQEEKQQRQAILQAYRTLCYKTWNARWNEKEGYLLSGKEPEVAILYKRLFARAILVEARTRLERIIFQTKDYQQIVSKVIALDMEPCIACTDAFIPRMNEDDILNTAKGTIAPQAKDIVVFSFLPDLHADRTFCVLSWFRNSQRVSKFIDAYRLDELSEDERFWMLFEAATHRSLLYVSPKWWNQQSAEAQARFSMVQVAEALEAQAVLNQLQEKQV